MQGTCALCGRERRLSFHHFIPRKCHTNKWYKKRFTREEMQQGVNICTPCHTFIHATFDEKGLGRAFSTLELLKADPRVQKFISWIRRQ